MALHFLRRDANEDIERYSVDDVGKLDRRIHEAQFHGFTAERPHVILGGAQDRRPSILVGGLEKCRDSAVRKLRHRFSLVVQQARKVIDDVIPE